MLAPMSTFVGLEAKQALEAAETVLGEMLAPDTGGLFALMAKAIGEELSSGRYPKLMMFVSMHQVAYPRVAEVVGVLMVVAMRNRATAARTGIVQ